MSIIYVSDPKTKLGTEENRIIAQYDDGTKHSVPIESVESITFLCRAHITVACMEKCLQLGIPVSFMSKGGHYFGRLNNRKQKENSICQIHERFWYKGSKILF